MSEMNLNERIYELRREREWTQEQLAQKLGVSYQAVSKWENAQACPDISLLPAIADLFEVSIDSLFGREEEPAQRFDLPWEDDQAYHLAIYAGRRLLKEREIKELNKKGELCTVRLVGEARDVYCALGLTCEGDIRGDVQAGGGVTCEDVGGDVHGGGVTCGDVGGNVHGGGVTCGDVGGDVHGGGVKCGDIGGNVEANGDVRCEGDIGGDVQAGGKIECGEVSGSVEAVGDVACGDVEGNVTSRSGNVSCGDVNGNAYVTGTLQCDEISGSVTYTTPDGKPADGAKVVTHRMQKVRHEWKTDDGRELSVEWYAPRKDKDKDEGDSDEDDDNE